MVLSGQVREMNQVGNDSADEAAGLMEGEGYMRRFLMRGTMSLVFVVSGTPELGICIGSPLPLQELLRMMTVYVVLLLNPCVWSVGSLPKTRRFREGVRNHATLFGPRSLPSGRWGFLPVAVQKNRSHVFIYFLSKTMNRHVSRTHRVDLAWLFDQITWDPGLHIRFRNTNQQIADILTQGSFSRHRWLQLTQLFNSTTLASYDSHFERFDFVCSVQQRPLDGKKAW